MTVTRKGGAAICWKIIDFGSVGFSPTVVVSESGACLKFAVIFHLPSFADNQLQWDDEQIAMIGTKHVAALLTV